VGAGDRLVITLSGSVTNDVLGTVVPALRVTVRLGGGLRDAGGVSQNMTAADVPVRGSWGDASQPQFLASSPAIALDYGGQPGLGPGDAVLLQFNQPVAQVPVASKAALDAVQIEAPAVVDTRRQVWAGVLPSAPPLPGHISQASSSSAASPKLLLNGTFKHATTLLYQAGLSSDVIIGAPACPRVAPPGGRSGAHACVNSRGYRMGPSLNGRIQEADQSDP
jgi:hypothetical protein